MLETIKEVFQKHKKTIPGFFLAAVIILIALGPAFLHIIPGEEAMFVIILILLVYLELLEWRLGGTQESMKTILKDLQDRLKSPASINEDQSSAKRKLISFVESENPKEADMLEYSSATVYDILEALVKKRTKIRLLLKNPKKAPYKEQEMRICGQLRQIKAELKDGDFEIGCYNQQASLRGTKFDDKLINVGWYTYHIRDKTGKMRIRGHTNPVLTLKRGKDGYDKIKEFFDEVFKNLMKEAVPLNKVCGNCDEEDCNLSGEKEWLDKVSKQR